MGKIQFQIVWLLVVSFWYMGVESTGGQQLDDVGQSVREIPYGFGDPQPQSDVTPLPIRPPPSEADLEYILKLIERKKWQWPNSYRALEKHSNCLYTYRDIAVQLVQVPPDVCPSLTAFHNPKTSGSDETDRNETESSYPYPCSPRIENVTAGVNVVNSSECLRILGQDPESDEDGATRMHCSVVLFFSTSCPFSIEMAPSFSAFGRAFPGVNVMAVDVSQSSGLFTRHGIVAVPDILLFHRGKAVVRFNYTERSYDNLVTFLQTNTGLEPLSGIEVSAIDYEGPLPTTLTTTPDYLLWFSNTFVLLFGIYIIKQRLGESILGRVREYMDYARQVWRTGEFYEQVGVHENEDNEFG